MDKSCMPVVGKKYNHFDDGKIRESRRSVVEIIDKIKFEDIDEETKQLWEYEVDSCDWLYSKNTDYFFIGMMENPAEKVIYVRDEYGGWFSLGFWAGRLDADGKLYKRMLEEIERMKK